MLYRMLHKRREYHLGLGEIVVYRMWTALVQSIMEGLPYSALPLPTSLQEFLAEYSFKHVNEEENRGSGISPLMLSAMSGNVTVTKEIVTSHSVDMNARLQVDMPDFGSERGMTPLHLAASYCPSTCVHDIIQALLTGGAEPNSMTTAAGITPLMSAVSYHRLKGVEAMLELSGSRLNLEQRSRSSSATALLVAAFSGTTPIVAALLRAGARKGQMDANGNNELTLACQNVKANPSMLELLCGTDGSFPPINLNYQTKPRLYRQSAVNMLHTTLVKSRTTPSDHARVVAHSDRATALHHASRMGHLEIVLWLLENGAHVSLTLPNSMARAAPFVVTRCRAHHHFIDCIASVDLCHVSQGCTPLDLARRFGPHPEVENVLGSVMLGRSLRVLDPTNGWRRHRRRSLTRRRSSTGSMSMSPSITPEYRGNCAVRYEMWLMPVSEFIHLSELRPHQELRATGKLVRFDASMRGVFFISHQWCVSANCPCNLLVADLELINGAT